VTSEFTKDWPSGIQHSFLVDQAGVTKNLFRSLEAAVLTAIALVMITCVATLGVRPALMIGTSIPMENDDGQTRSFLVTRMDDETLTVDGNNPLCGREVVFKLEILTVRDATEEETSAGGAIAAGAAVDPSPMRSV